jgi:hypothetical protein
VEEARLNEPEAALEVLSKEVSCEVKEPSALMRALPKGEMDAIDVDAMLVEGEAERAEGAQDFGK